MLALVKWIGGADDKKYTVGIPVEWIKGFNLEEFRSDKFDASLSYVIEWRGKKKPAGGWPVFDAYVIEVSHRRRVLENKLSAIDGLLFPTKRIEELSTSTLQTEGQDTIQAVAVMNNHEDDQSNGSREQRNNTPIQSTRNPDNLNGDVFNKFNQTEQVLSEKSKSAGSEKDSNNNKDKEKKSTKNNLKLGQSDEQAFKRDKGVKRSIVRQIPSDVQSDEHDGESEISGCRPLESKGAKRKLHNVATGGNQGMQHTLTAIQDELRNIRRRQTKKHADDFYSSDSSDDDTVEIGPRGSGIFITDVQWKVAKASSSYTAMGINLLLSLFAMEVLLRSNLRGGGTKIGQLEGKARKHQALDKQRIDALYRKTF